jgi:hypothetical protein
MSAANNGGNLPAFPLLELDSISGQVVDQHFSVSVRDYFAAKAMAVIMADMFAGGDTDERHAKQAASAAYVVADAMLAERAQ